MAARLTSAIFVSAIIRRVNGAGGFAAILRKGAEEAGAIFFVAAYGRGEGSDLYGQAPQSFFADEDRPAAGGRLFEKLGDRLDQEEIDRRFEKEARLDPDFWVVELELFGRPITDYIDIAS